MAQRNPLKFILDARENRGAVGAFNVDSVDMLYGVLDGAEQANRPTIVQLTQDTLDIWGWKRAFQVLRAVLDDARLEVAIHLDHAKDVDVIKRALDMGVKSVMYDGSMLSMDQNISHTQKVVELGQKFSAMVEAEIGHVGRKGEEQSWESLTLPEDAKRFCDATGVDCLAVAIGTKHGQQRDADMINIQRLREIHQMVPLPLVLHGSSGVDDEMLQQLAENGVGKVNIGTQLRRIWWQEISRHPEAKPREVLSRSRDRIANYVATKLDVLNGKRPAGR